MRYEDLVSADPETWHGLMDYLELDFDPASLEAFSKTELQGRLGDKAGVARYAGLSAEPVTKWKRSISNPLRRAWCRRYLSWLGAERLKTMGYDASSLRSELDSIELGWDGLATDSVDVVSSALRGVVRRRARRPAPPAGPPASMSPNGQHSRMGAEHEGGVR